MDLLEKLDRQEKKLTIAILDKLVVGYYEHSLVDLRELISDAAIEIRRQSKINQALGETLRQASAGKQLEATR